MQYGWRDEWRLRARRAQAAAAAAFDSARRWLFSPAPRGWLLTWGLAVAIAGVAGGSTATADWVPGSDAVAGPAVVGALAAGLLALLRPLPWPLGVLGALAAGTVYTLYATGAAEVGAGLSSALGGDFAHAAGAVLFAISLLMWVVGAWLPYCVLRWRRPLLGLVPGIAVVATNVLNFPTQQAGAVFGFVALSIALLLWTAYSGRLQDATRGGLRLSAESRWDFWESGLVAGAALLLVSFIAPPLSTVDRTVDAQTGIIKTWSDIQLRLHHELPGGANASTYSTGFSDQVRLGHPLARNQTVVFTYRVVGTRATSIYFRGLDVAATAGGAWQYAGPALTGVLPAGRKPPYTESYQAQQNVSVKVQMLRPPQGSTSVYFYPGQFESISRDTLYTQEAAAGGGAPLGPGVDTVDRVASLSRRPTTGQYTASGAYSVASAAQLRTAGTSYPLWVQPYAGFTPWLGPGFPGPNGSTNAPLPYRDPVVEAQVNQLARQVTAGATNPYDAATDIEDFLRSNFKYTLSPPATPAGQDPLAFFLFDSKKGYCEYFATAMGDMLRSIGIPTRLVNGYGPGVFDQKSNRFVVRESDAHTWVEVYFPTYGWIPFEPTPDGTYFPIPRGQAACHVDSTICEGLITAAGVAANRVRHFDDTLSQQESQGLHPVQPQGGQPLNPWGIAGLALLVLLLAAALLVARILTPRSAGAAWRRTQLLGRLAGVPTVAGETPLEFGRRLAKQAPRGAKDALRLAQGFTLAAYAPPEAAAQGLDDVLGGWRGLRPVLIREAAARAARRRPR